MHRPEVSGGRPAPGAVGPNEIRREEPRRRIIDFARQLVDPLALLLWAAAIFALADGTSAVAVTIVASSSPTSSPI
jgi:hypothetical protein